MAGPNNSMRSACWDNVVSKSTLRGLASVGKSFYVDGVNGNDNNNGLSPEHALATLVAAEDLCTAEKHDIVYLIAGDTAQNPSDTIAWDKDYTHLIGLGPDFPGIGCRSRVVGTAANAIGVAGVINFSGRGCIVKNVQFQNETAAASGGAIVSGPYNYFENVYFNGMNATNSANKATSFCLSVTGAENYFKNCTIGSVQTITASTNAVLLISNGANTFEGCRIQHYSHTTGNFLVNLVAGTGGLSLVMFKECVFYNQSVNWAASSTDVFNVDHTGSHYVLLKDCVLLGGNGTNSWADTVTHVYHDSAAPATGGQIAIAVNA